MTGARPRMSSRKRAIVVGVLLVALITVWILFLESADSHHLSPRHFLWKHGLWPYSPEVALRYFNVDRELRLSLNGKTRSEITKWFPRLIPPAQADDYQRSYNKDVEDLDFLWIDDSAWGIVFEENRVKEFRLLKG